MNPIKIAIVCEILTKHGLVNFNFRMTVTFECRCVMDSVFGGFVLVLGFYVSNRSLLYGGGSYENFCGLFILCIVRVSM